MPHTRSASYACYEVPVALYSWLTADDPGFVGLAREPFAGLRWRRSLALVWPFGILNHILALAWKRLHVVAVLEVCFGELLSPS